MTRTTMIVILAILIGMGPAPGGSDECKKGWEMVPSYLELTRKLVPSPAIRMPTTVMGVRLHVQFS